MTVAECRDEIREALWDWHHDEQDAPPGEWIKSPAVVAARVLALFAGLFSEEQINSLVELDEGMPWAGYRAAQATEAMRTVLALCALAAPKEG